MEKEFSIKINLESKDEFLKLAAEVLELTEQLSKAIYKLNSFRFTAKDETPSTAATDELYDFPKEKKETTDFVLAGRIWRKEILEKQMHLLSKVSERCADRTDEIQYLPALSAALVEINNQLYSLHQQIALSKS